MRCTGFLDYATLLRWLLLNCLALIGIAALWYFGLLQTMLATDRTHISIAILAIFVLTALHCLFQTAEISNQLVASRKARETILAAGADGLHVVDDRVLTAQGRPLEPSVLTTHIANLLVKADVQGGRWHKGRRRQTW